MFASKKDLLKARNDQLSMNGQVLHLVGLLDKRLDYAIQRIASLEAKSKATSEFLEKVLKVEGLKFEYTPAKSEPAKYEIVKIGKEKK